VFNRTLSPRRLFAWAARAALVLLVAPYAFGPIYRFPDEAPFSGSQLWNPYAHPGGSWQRANLHAHGLAWSGLTNGLQPPALVAQRYRELGYSVPGVSNYQEIVAHDGVETLPLYEHGFNIAKRHQLAVGAHSVDWFDFPLWQAMSHRQYVIDRVKRRADLVALNHPTTRAAYTDDTLRSLTGYDLVEVVNGPFTAEMVWDEALSSGHAVWAVANDDSHDMDDPRRLAKAWNMIDAPSASTADVVNALRHGRSYAVLRLGALGSSSITTLSGIEVHDRTMTVHLAGAPSVITFIGNEGHVRKVVQNTTVADYTFTDADTYVRTVVDTPQTVLFLNPVVRWNGRTLPAPVATVDAALTWTLRGGIALGVLLLVARARLRQSVSRAAGAGVLAHGK
jgi:hypothetical protein